MTQPLALVFYERLMPGSQLVNQLKDLNYRVLAVNQATRLATAVKSEMPLLLLADFCASGDIRSAVALIKADAATSHIPIIAFAPDNEPAVLEGASQAGADFTVVESAAGTHLPQLIDQALHIE
jgi:CheY-like chemotaxis protein